MRLMLSVLHKPQKSINVMGLVSASSESICSKLNLIESNQGNTYKIINKLDG